MSIHKSSMNPKSFGVFRVEILQLRLGRQEQPKHRIAELHQVPWPADAALHAMLHCTPSGKPMAATKRHPQNFVDHSTRLYSCRSAHSAAVNGARLNGKVSRNRMMNQALNKNWNTQINQPEL